jgi:hypothetical protein
LEKRKYKNIDFKPKPQVKDIHVACYL